MMYVVLISILMVVFGLWIEYDTVKYNNKKNMSYKKTPTTESVERKHEVDDSAAIAALTIPPVG